MSKIYKINNHLMEYNDSCINRLDPYNPLDLPPNTVRVRTNDGNVPDKADGATYETATLVSGTTDVYDLYKSGTDFTQLLYGVDNVIEVLGANTSNVTKMVEMFRSCVRLTTVPLFDTSKVTDMGYMFAYNPSLTNVPLFNTSNVTDMVGMFARCYHLTTVPLFDTSSVISMEEMFYDCTRLTNVPLFDTSKVTNMWFMFKGCTVLQSVPLFNTSKVTTMGYMFSECTNVQSGALALYQQASSQANPPSNHYKTFYNCGKNTTAGSAELAKIPIDWK